MIAATTVRARPSDLGQIPDDWAIETLAGLGGQVTSGSRGWATFYAKYGDLFVRITNLRRDNVHLDLADQRFVLLPALNTEAARTRLREGDLLVSITADIGIIGYVDEHVPSPAYINQHIARVRLPANRVSPKFVAYYLSSWAPQRTFVGATDTGAKAGMNLTTVGALKTVVPPLSEQIQIAATLSDIDQQIAALQRLITKKEEIKRGVMHQLLTGETRLPGFDEPWHDVRLGDMACIKTGSRNNQDKSPLGRYPFFVRSATVERIDTYSYDCEAILVPGEGGIGSIFHYIRGKFEVHQRVYKISDFSSQLQGGFAYYYLQQFFGRHAMENTVKATVDSLRLPTFLGFEMSIPSSVDEQAAISTALQDQDRALERLRARLRKANEIKHGMMQQLLTGRARLAGTGGVL